MHVLLLQGLQSLLAVAILSPLLALAKVYQHAAELDPTAQFDFIVIGCEPFVSSSLPSVVLTRSRSSRTWRLHCRQPSLGGPKVQCPSDRGRWGVSCWFTLLIFDAALKGVSVTKGS
jgi:hypothetical protein